MAGFFKDAAVELTRVRGRKDTERAAILRKPQTVHYCWHHGEHHEPSKT
jgi:hypothetical protein